ncbi:transposase [Mesosutterella sp. AGMB02718]|uniref:Transposase n=1 Tax=Mesosutterella faecium TaxID=2925194 RepID=A0ABT7IPH4_9BURK|nr:transposase [Mesosutterella sp. AGMB02718]MDL2060298.1 transposase [Mesosutterella sp. AGMB02718]
MATTEKPDYVIQFQKSKPRQTEIKKIGGRWYLYERFSKYDPEIKRSWKISGKCLGAITPEGLVKTTRRLAEPKPAVLNDVVAVGNEVYFWENTAPMRRRLRKYFPDLWRQIYTAVYVRSALDPRFRRLQSHYENSLFSYLCPGLSFQRPCIRDLLEQLGRSREAIRGYMREDLEDREAFILFDGHRILSASQTMTTAELGYDSKCRFKPQINLVYVFSLGEDTGMPLYYKQYAGSTPDVSCFSDLLRETSMNGKNYTVIADKGFASEDGFCQLEDDGLKYLLPLRRNCAAAADLIPESPRGYQKGFTYHSRSIQYSSFDCQDKASRLHIYFDPELYSDEMATATARMEAQNRTVGQARQAEENRRKKGKGRLTDAELEALRPVELSDIHDAHPAMGVIIIKTNRLDLEGEAVYYIYKQRQNIEQFFKTYSETLDFEASYMRGATQEEAWLFLNHLAAGFCVKTIEDIYSIGEGKNISYKDLTSGLEKIRAARLGKSWQMPPIKRSTARLCEKLGINVTAEKIEKLVAGTE